METANRLKNILRYIALVVVIILGLVSIIASSGIDIRSWIVFESYRDGNSEIFKILSDGSQETQLTDNSWDDRFPKWSPDHEQIAFLSRQHGGTHREIYLMNADGTERRGLTNSSNDKISFAWSPSGERKIAFTARLGRGNRQVFTLDLATGNLQQLTDVSALNEDEAWSLDGTKIAFTSNRKGDRDIFVMNADGTELKRLTDMSGDEVCLTWSPDSSKIAFVNSEKFQKNRNIFVINAEDGSDLKQITDYPYDSSGGEVMGCPKWSNLEEESIQSRIGYTAKQGYAGGDPDQEIFVINPDGTGKKQLTNNSSLDRFGDWSPLDLFIVFQSFQDGNGEIYTMKADGSEQMRLTNNSYNDQNPDW